MQLIRLRCVLCYENEARVEDKESEILTICNPRGLFVSSESPACAIEFRIEKVSRRKDGQRFRLLVEPEYIEGPRPKVLIGGVFSQPINVMSKRKPGDRVPAKRAQPVVDIPEEASSTFKMLHGTMLQMQKTMDEVKLIVKKQSKQIQQLETALHNSAANASAGMMFPMSNTVLVSQSSTDSSSSGVPKGPGSFPRGSPGSLATQADPSSSTRPTRGVSNETSKSQPKTTLMKKSQPTLAPTLPDATAGVAITDLDDITPPMPTSHPMLTQGFSQSLMNDLLHGDYMGTSNSFQLPPDVSVAGMKRLRSTEIEMSYNSAGALSMIKTTALAGEDQSNTSFPPGNPPLMRGMSRLISCSDVGALFDEAASFAEAAASAPKKARLQVVESETASGDVTMQVFTNDRALAKQHGTK
jgi:hypothetical protein